MSREYLIFMAGFNAALMLINLARQEWPTFFLGGAAIFFIHYALD